MNILLVTDAYPPEIRSSSHLMLELAEELVDRGHHLTVLTSWPRYNLSTPSAANGLSEKESEDGITVIRVHTLPHHKVNFIARNPFFCEIGHSTNAGQIVGGENRHTI